MRDQYLAQILPHGRADKEISKSRQCTSEQHNPIFNHIFPYTLHPKETLQNQGVDSMW